MTYIDYTSKHKQAQAYTSGGEVGACAMRSVLPKIYVSKLLHSEGFAIQEHTHRYLDMIDYVISYISLTPVDSESPPLKCSSTAKDREVQSNHRPLSTSASQVSAIFKPHSLYRNRASR
jgi:hypothetical protein